MNKSILEIVDLNASVHEKPILTNFKLRIREGETHVIMGPNGSGKSTLAKVLAGHPTYKITKGVINFYEKNLLTLSPEQRSHAGLFLAFQTPLEITGVTNYEFLRAAYNEKQKCLNLVEADPLQFLDIIKPFLRSLKMNNEFLSRNLNDGFSGGEKKRNEILQLLLLRPKLVILDEIDSGLDIDSLQVICLALKQKLPKSTAFIIITHYAKLLHYLEPSFVHIMGNGKIIKTGDLSLVSKLENVGYEGI